MGKKNHVYFQHLAEKLSISFNDADKALITIVSALAVTLSPLEISDTHILSTIPADIQNYSLMLTGTLESWWLLNPLFQELTKKHTDTYVNDCSRNILIRAFGYY